MWVRKRIDIRKRDIVAGMGKCLLPRDANSLNRTALNRRIDSCWTPGSSQVFLSVRSGFDSLLETVPWPAGSEIIMSGLTIPDMPRIVRHHGYSVAGVDIDLRTLGPRIDQIERMITPRTKAIVVAHLFGGLCDMTPIVEIARRHSLMIIEDCAQAYHGPRYQGDSRAQVSMFSFGPIKTNTSLGGAVFRIRDPELLGAMRQTLNQQPVQTRSEFGRRLAKYAFVKLLSTRLVCGQIAGFLGWLGRDHDRLATGMARGFAGTHFFEKIRRQPSPTLLNLLSNRLERFDASTVDRRAELGQRLCAQLEPNITVVGAQMLRPTYWVFPILVDRPRFAVQLLWKNGFDATNSSSLQPVTTIAQANTNLPSVAFLLRHIVFLPFDARMPQKEMDRMARILKASSVLSPRSIPVPSTSGSAKPVSPDLPSRTA